MATRRGTGAAGANCPVARRVAPRALPASADAPDRPTAPQLENERRRHNYIPFLVALTRILAKKGKLGALVDEAARRRAAQEHARRGQRRAGSRKRSAQGEAVDDDAGGEDEGSAGDME